MSNISLEDIKLITESLGVKLIEKDIKDTRKYFYRFGKDVFEWRSEEFNPLTNDADCFKVLEALIKLNPVAWLNQNPVGVWLILDGDQEDDKAYSSQNSSSDLNEAIVKAYLSLITGAK